MNVLITGGAGFIGSYLADYYLDKGDSVLVIDDLSTGNLNNIKNRAKKTFQFIKADILDIDKFSNLISTIDIVYHFAAIVGIFRVLEEPDKVINVNVCGTEKLFRVIANSNRKPRVIVASSSEVYGLSNNNFNEESDLIIVDNFHTRTSYAISKIAMESVANTFFHMYDIPITILRLFNMIGSNQSGSYGMVVPRFIKSALLNQPLTIYGNGKQTRSFMNVIDAVKIMDNITSNNLTIGETINLGSEQEISINELAKIILKLTKSQSTIKYLSYEEAYHEEYEDFMFRKPDIAKLKHMLKIDCAWNLKPTLQNIINDYLKTINENQ